MRRPTTIITLTTLSLVSLVVFLLYFPISFGVFQHDEWGSVSRYFLNQESFWGKMRTAFTPFVTHYVPLHQVGVQIYLRIFGLNYNYYAFASIAAHLFSALLVFFWARKIFQQTFYGLVVFAVFAFGVAGYQATSWPLSDINTHGATIFGVLSLLVFLKYLDSFEKAKQTKRYVWTSFGLFLISLLFKEITIALPFVYFLLIYLLKPSLWKKNRYFLIPLVTIIIFYVTLRALLFLTPRVSSGDRLVTTYQSKSEIASNLFTFPTKTISQSIIPVNILLSLSRGITKILPETVTGQPGTTLYDQFAEGITLQGVNLFLFLVVLLVGVKIYKKGGKNLGTTYFFGLIFGIVNSWVYVLSPGRDGYVPVIDSRNIYFPFIGITMCFTTVFIFLRNKNRIVGWLFLFMILTVNVFSLKNEVKVIADRGKIRKNILTQVKRDYPVLPPKVVFYIESDSSYYGLPEEVKILPFQTNFGSTLFIWYLPTEKFPKEMVDKGWLFSDLTAEGYKEIGGRGFGYFWDITKLKKVVLEKNLSPEMVFGYRYFSLTNRLVNISEEVRARITNK